MDADGFWNGAILYEAKNREMRPSSQREFAIKNTPSPKYTRNQQEKMSLATTVFLGL